MAGHAQLKCVMTECSKTQIRLTGLISKQCMNEDSVALIMCIQNTNSKTKELELSADVFLKDTSSSVYGFQWLHSAVPARCHAATRPGSDKL